MQNTSTVLRYEVGHKVVFHSPITKTMFIGIVVAHDETIPYSYNVQDPDGREWAAHWTWLLPAYSPVVAVKFLRDIMARLITYPKQHSRVWVISYRMMDTGITHSIEFSSEEIAVKVYELAMLKQKRNAIWGIDTSARNLDFFFRVEVALNNGMYWYPLVNSEGRKALYMAK